VARYTDVHKSINNQTARISLQIYNNVKELEKTILLAPLFGAPAFVSLGDRVGVFAAPVRGYLRMAPATRKGFFGKKRIFLREL